MPTPDAVSYALALPRLPGLGRVAAHRLLDAFPTFEALRATPREQVLHRLKGVPGAAALVATLFDDAAIEAALEAVAAEQAVLTARGIAVLTPNLPAWPAGLARLDRRDRPAALYVYGRADLLARPTVAFLGATGLPPEAFEYAQALIPALAARGVVPMGALASGFDVVVCKVAADVPSPPVLVAGCGLGVVPPPMRPVAMQAAQANGALVSPFERGHGPFAHDEVDRARVMAALASVAVVFGGAPGGPEHRALDLPFVLAHPAVAGADPARCLSGIVAADADRLAALAAPGNVPQA